LFHAKKRVNCVQTDINKYKIKNWKYLTGRTPLGRECPYGTVLPSSKEEKNVDREEEEENFSTTVFSSRFQSHM